MASAEAPGNLGKIDHIVVLMLENRSFDHMLGYLSLDGGREDVDGLRPGFSNEHGGRAYPIHHLTSTRSTEALDPDHDAAAADRQINGGRMDGFVSAFAATLARRHVGDADPGLVMGYYDGRDLPVYDHLAAHYTVCDHWHCSVPGSTWPNRLYALCGRADGSRDDRPHGLPPIYDKPSFVRHLDRHGVSWRWYSFDPATLRCADGHYRLGHHDHFAYFSKAKLRWQTRLLEAVVIDEGSASFLDDAARGTLPAVSWIDPNFNDLNLYGSSSNDDHPPSDVRDGQDLVLSAYRALASGPGWERSLLVITYDEHGGFFDHVPPPGADDDDPRFRRLGVRVPALVVSPWVEPGSVAKTVFDHASIAKTILRRFCPEALAKEGRRGGLLSWLRRGQPQWPGRRVAAANDLGPLLSRATPRAAPPHDDLVQDAAERAAERTRRRLREEVVTHHEPAPLSDLQARMAHAAAELRTRGLPPGQP